MPRGKPGTKAPHGTASRYQNHGCRCDKCRAANTAEEIEHAMDAQFHEAHTIWQTDLYDSVMDARSEARYEDDPSAEPVQQPFDPGEPVFVCIVDESAGFRG